MKYNFARGYSNSDEEPQRHFGSLDIDNPRLHSLAEIEREERQEQHFEREERYSEQD